VSPPHHAELYTLSLHDALPIYPGQEAAGLRGAGREVEGGVMSHLSDLQIDQGLMQGSMPAHAGECERCRRRWEELARDREAFRVRARPAAFADAVLGRRRPRRWLWLLALAPALLLLM